MTELEVLEIRAHEYAAAEGLPSRMARCGGAAVFLAENEKVYASDDGSFYTDGDVRYWMDKLSPEGE